MPSLIIHNLSKDQIIRIARILNETTGVNVVIKNYPECRDLYYEKVEKRRAFVYSTLMDVGECRLEHLYRLVRRKGYTNDRKTFTRDINFLQMMGKLEKEVIRGGIDGCHTILKPIKQNNER